MARYSYKVKDIKGKITTVESQANDVEEVYKTVRSLGMFATDIQEVKEKVKVKPLKSKNLAEFTRELATMLNAGISLVQAISITAGRESNVKLKTIYMDLNNKIVSGVVLSDAMEEKSGIFPELMINMIRYGEEGGQLNKTINDAADYYEKDYKLKNKVKGAMLYPAFLLGLVTVSIIVIFTVVLPTFFELFDSMDVLPWNTRFLIWLSNMMIHHGVVLIYFIVSFVLVFIKVMEIESVKAFVAKKKIHTPIAGKLLKIVYTARFARALSSMYANGVPLVDAVSSAANVIGNTYIQNQFVQVVEDMYNGVLLSTSVDRVDGIDSKAAVSIYIGEESGRLNVMLDTIAESFEFQSDEATKKLTTLIEPVMIVLIAIVVGFVMISVILPIYQYYNTLG